MSGKNELLVPEATKAMKDLKIKAANDTIGREKSTTITENNYEETLEAEKWEIANDLGLTEKINDQGWQNMTTSEVGKIGGRMGGKIGGAMVKNLIAAAEAQMAPVEEEAIVPQSDN